MTVRVYRHPVIRIPLPPDWLFYAETFAKDQVQKRPPREGFDPEKARKWSETWYLCTCAFLWYFGGNMEAPIQRAAKTGWTPSVIHEAGGHRFHLTTSQIHEEFSFGSKVSGIIPSKLHARSDADIVVMSLLIAPDVDIIGWLPKDAMAQEGQRYVIHETSCRPMSECPGLVDQRKWYM